MKPINSRTHYQVAQADTQAKTWQKSFHLTNPRKNFKIFFPTLQKKTPDTQARQKSTRQLCVTITYSLTA